MFEDSFLQNSSFSGLKNKYYRFNYWELLFGKKLLFPQCYLTCKSKINITLLVLIIIVLNIYILQLSFNYQ